VSFIVVTDETFNLCLALWQSKRAPFK